MEKPLQVGSIARFFHPRTLGVMHRGVVVKVYDDGSVTVKFDVEDWEGKRTFRTDSQYIKRER